VHEAGEATRAVAALFDLTAVGVNPVAKSTRFWVGSSTTRTWSQPMPKWRSAGSAPAPAGTVLVDGVEHDKVVAETVHLGD
jgi:hypothetical protein